MECRGTLAAVVNRSSIVECVTAFVMMVPIVILYTTLSKRAFVLHMLVVYGIATAVLGPPALIVGLFFLVPSIVMGHLYRKQTSARKVLTATLLTFLAEMLLELVMFDLLFNMSLLSEIKQMVRQMVDNLNAQGLLMNSLSAEFTDSYIQVLIHSIPMAFITVSFLLAVVAHADRKTVSSVDAIIGTRPPASEGLDAAAYFRLLLFNRTRGRYGHPGQR